ncbi:MAG: DUF3883 domain-containing protein [Verrucomicrobiota bacterium]|jgi:hypothetical protein
MRIIKLSPDDDDFKTRPKVDEYFRDKLPKRKPPGMFLLTKRAIGRDGISPHEKLVFTYKGECVYKARAESTRKKNSDQGDHKYPYYFLVNVPSIEAIQGTLPEIQIRLTQAGLADKNLVRSRAWPTFPDGERIAQIIDAFVSPDQDTHEMEEIVLETLENEQAKGQGFLLDKKLRRALEHYAMDAAKTHFESLEFVREDRSKNHPYDLHCRRGKEFLYVEVKGTQTDGEQIILTNGELEFARSHKGQMALFILHSITVSEVGGDYHLAGGERRPILPWDVDHGWLKPLSFMYRIRGG